MNILIGRGPLGVYLGLLLCTGCDFPSEEAYAPTPIAFPAPAEPLPTSLPTPPPTTQPTAAGVVVPLISVTDGDTIRVQFEGARERIRLIGIDTPETEHSPRGPQPFADEATAALTELLSGRTIRLRFDVERRDRYGRLLAYVYADELFVNEQLTSLGWARQLTIPPNVQHAERFERAVRQAREAHRGIWQ